MRSLYGHDVWSDKQVENNRERISEGIACIVTVFAFPLVRILMLYLGCLLQGPAYHQNCVTAAGAGVFACSRW